MPSPFPKEKENGIPFSSAARAIKTSMAPRMYPVGLQSANGTSTEKV
jgi:hypothetical protein